MASRKRQRRVDHGGNVTLEAPKLEGATMSIPSKKSKTRAAAKVKEEAPIKSENVSPDCEYYQMAAAQVAVAAVEEEEEEKFLCSNGPVWLDEQMSWGTIWCPLWDVEFMSEAQFGLFSDHVVWDDDIWGLRTTSKEIPVSNR